MVSQAELEAAMFTIPELDFLAAVLEDTKYIFEDYLKEDDLTEDERQEGVRDLEMFEKIQHTVDTIIRLRLPNRKEQPQDSVLSKYDLEEREHKKIVTQALHDWANKQQRR